MNLVAKARSFLRTRAQAYQITFDNVQGKRVLKDLARFCRAHQTTVHADERMTHVLEGRREVWLRIQQHLRLSEEELWQLLDGRSEKEPR